MASLTTTDKQVLEKLFQMSTGYVLNFVDRTFAEFFRDDVGIDIHDKKFDYASGSKANRMRGFWQVADDVTVGKSIQKLIAYIDTQILVGSLTKNDLPDDLIRGGRGIANRLLGPASVQAVPNQDEFITKEFRNVSIEKLDLDSAINRVLKQRVEEIKKCIQIDAPLAAVFLCGSSLEGILLGIASKRAKEFNESSSSPKDKTGKVKQFPEWTLNDFINVARELQLIGEDVKKFSHALRDFRNYIHPFQQMSSNFDPDGSTAKICWQVVQAAITQLSNS